jgi:general secretion pathway protein D
MLSPTAVLASNNGKKHFKEGLKHEYAEEWDQAVEKFALAIVANPRNPEYRLHYQRSLFNASQMFMKQGRAQAEQKDYAGAYISFRRAYGYDPVNELAKSEMERMVRLQRLENGDIQETTKTDTVKLVPTSYNGVSIPRDFVVPQQLERLRDVPFPNPTDLQWLIKELAKDLDLNVLFDVTSRLETRRTKIELKNVTAAKALDYLFLQENLFFQRIGPRTIIVADGAQRQKFQQLVLRTFYLANASPKDVANVVKTAIPAQPGRTPTIVLTDDATNSITIRDTSENIRLIGKLISSLDKDRAEVVMDVAIYEVSKSDLMRLGNQIGNTVGTGNNATNQLNNLGGIGAGVVRLGGNFAAGTAVSIASGILLPSSVISAFQSKNDTKLLASTQIHAFNNEDSSARIGQRVPVRTASFAPIGGGGTGGNNPNNNFVGDVINYEQTGLTLKFKPLVFPNQDVQVTMEIESKDVSGVSDENLNPTFTERTIKGTARIQNNKTLLLASVAQDVQNEGRAGLPLLGLIPIIGRLFSTPTKDNRQVDIVIAVTPRVIRAPAILPEDEEERETGSLAVPTTSSLEAMVIQEEVEEQLATARRLGNNAQVQLPDRPLENPVYVKSADVPTNAQVENKTKAITENTLVNVSENKSVNNAETRIERIDSSPAVIQQRNTVENNSQPTDSEVKTLEIKPTAENLPTRNNPLNNITLEQTSLKSNFVEEIKTQPFALPENPVAELQLLPGVREMKAGEKTKLAVIVRSTKAFNSAVIGLSFNESKLAVKTVELGDVFGEENARKQVTPFINQNGKMFVTLTVSNTVGDISSGVLAYIEIEALADGKHELVFDRDALNLTSANGENFAVKF